MIAIFPFVTVQRIFVVGDSSCAAQSAFLSRLHEGLPCRENRVSRERSFYPCRYRHGRDCRVMLDENKNEKSIERRMTREMKRRMRNARAEWSKEFNERFLSCLLAVNIADGRKGVSLYSRLFGHEYKCLSSIGFMCDRERNRKHIVTLVIYEWLVSHFLMKYLFFLKLLMDR